MKTRSILLGIASLAAGLSSALAQTAVTDPVGYITLPVAGGGTATNPTVSYIGASLVNKVDFQGAVASTSGTTTVTFAASALSALTTGVNAAGQPKYYAEIATGANAGVWTDIVSNTADSITISDPIAANFAGATVKIRKHHTFNSVFGSVAGSLTITPGLDLGTADEVHLFNPVTQTPQIYFFSTDDLGVQGWTTNGREAGEDVIAPSDGLKVLRKSAATANLVQVGHVKTGPTVFAVEPGLNVVTTPKAVGVVISQMGLHTSAGFVGGLDFNSADEVLDFVNGSPSQYFFSTDDLSPGWTPTDFTVREGTAVRVKHKGTGFNWVIPAQTIN